MVKGRALGSGVGCVRGRLPAGGRCRGPTVGGSFLVSPWCVPWWPLVGWLWTAFVVYRIHGGTTVRWRAAVGDAVSFGGVACVVVVCVVCGGASCVVLGGSSWWSVVAVRGGRSWAWRLLGGCGTCGVGMACGGGGARVWACTAIFAFSGCGVPGVSALCSLRDFLLCPSPAPLFFLVRFVSFLGGGGCVWLRYGVCGAGRGHGCVPVLVLVWTWGPWGMVDGRLLRFGFPVCVSALGHPVALGFRGASQGGGGGGRSAAVVVWCLCGRSWLSSSVAGRGRASGCALGAGCLGSGHSAVWCRTARVGRWGVAGVQVLCVGRGACLVGVGGKGSGVGYVCAEGLGDWAGALWVMQRVVKMLVMPLGRVL